MSALAVIVGVILLGAAGLGVLCWAMARAARLADDQLEACHRADVDRRDAAETERRERLAFVQADLRRRQQGRRAR